MAKLSRRITGSDFKPMVLVEQVSNFLKEAILEGILKGGDQLVEADLKEDFGISRSPLREAFRELEKGGLVEIIPRKGAFVKKISRRDIEEHFPVRSVLEGLAAREAHHRLTDEDLHEMTVAFDSMKKAAAEGDGKKLWAHHIIFHEVFINASENLLLINLLKTMRMHTKWYRFSYQYYKEDFGRILAVHQTILELFKQRDTDPKKIQQVVGDHIEVAAVKFLQYLEELEQVDQKET